MRAQLMLMLHGFPGNEKNLDLEYSIRRAGWNSANIIANMLQAT